MTTLGTPRIHHRKVDSTNRHARELAEQGAPHGTLVTAAEQSAGRGRQGRAWSAPAGTGLLMSVLLRDPYPLLSLAAGAAVADTAAHFRPDQEVLIKWPNDVWLEGKKVAGILVEGRPQERWAVLGIGLNVAISQDQFPPELRTSATSLGRDKSELEAVLTKLLDALSVWTSANRADVLAAVRQRNALRRRSVSWADGQGVVADIDDEGRLLVETQRCIAALDAGEVHLNLD
ncbi:MAG: biotin--[acetyl-CoA-carboxylase] ligase [Solirubrobacterales bacterium]|nr:biotin--[acetyl-CoA-carboxylase] ligase [Solirubrobacterales bacterium]